MKTLPREIKKAEFPLWRTSPLDVPKNRVLHPSWMCLHTDSLSGHRA